MITLICGLPNAGKTTYSQRYDNVIHLDDCERPKRKHFEKLVAESVGDIVAEGVCNSVSNRRKFLKAIKHKPDKKVCILLDTPIAVCIERENNYRQRPASMIEQHVKHLELPTLAEGWDEIIIIKDYHVKGIDNQK